MIVRRVSPELMVYVKFILQPHGGVSCFFNTFGNCDKTPRWVPDSSGEAHKQRDTQLRTVQFELQLKAKLKRRLSSVLKVCKQSLFPTQPGIKKMMKDEAVLRKIFGSGTCIYCSGTKQIFFQNSSRFYQR